MKAAILIAVFLLGGCAELTPVMTGAVSGHFYKARQARQLEEKEAEKKEEEEENRASS